MTGEPEIVGLVRVLLVKVCVAESRMTVPVALGRVMVRSAVGSTTVSVVSKSSEVEPSKTMLAPAEGVPVNVGLEMVGEVMVLLVRVWVFAVPTTSPSPAAMPCRVTAVPLPSLYDALALAWRLASR